MQRSVDTWDLAIPWVNTSDVVYAGAPFILLVHAVQPNKVLLRMTGNLCHTNMLRQQVTATEPCVFDTIIK